MKSPASIARASCSCSDVEISAVETGAPLGLPRACSSRRLKSPSSSFQLGTVRHPIHRHQLLCSSSEERGFLALSIGGAGVLGEAVPRPISCLIYFNDNRQQSRSSGARCRPCCPPHHSWSITPAILCYCRWLQEMSGLSRRTVGQTNSITLPLESIPLLDTIHDTLHYTP